MGRPAKETEYSPITSLADLSPDPHNANKHTERGSGMMEESIRRAGFGDSLTVDRHGVVISGNQRLETLADLQMDDPIVVQSDGTRPIVHQRVDLDLATDKRAKVLAIAQNRVGQVNLEWDADVVKLMEPEDLSGLFAEHELGVLLGSPIDNPADHWNGMPEFQQDDLTAFRTIHVHFANHDNLAAFATLVGQIVTDKTRSLWFPAAEIGRYADKRYEDGAGGGE